MKFPRASGILLHPTSLPGGCGIGELGPAAYSFVDFLQASSQKLWQVLPLNPTGYGDSPFQCLSASAGNPFLISMERLVEQGVLAKADLKSAPEFPQDRVDFGRVIEYKLPLLKQASRNFLSSAASAERRRFDGFCQANAAWLDNAALFMACKVAHHGPAWTSWEPGIAQRRPEALNEWTKRLAGDIEAIKYWQFEFFQQWQDLRSYCRGRDVRIIGDIPIYVAHDSADVWSNPELFCLDEKGNPTKVAGVPPDYFSATGQLWGNPIYNWALMKKTNYRWWIERFRSAFRLYDLMRIDHFRGFEAYWQVQASEPTAVKGEWVKGPGAELFAVLQESLGELPVVAENLGVITPEVEAIRQQLGFPGMAILQFAFGIDTQAPTFRPHKYVRELVAYTGTHDNDTAVGWWSSKGIDDSTRTPEDVRKEHELAQSYLHFTDDEPINWVLIRAVLASVADTAMIPLQDVLGCGREARMNLPGTSSGNWRWRFKPDALTPQLSSRLRELTLMFDR
jgi:4-alpha-glucanotransferase